MYRPRAAMLTLYGDYVRHAGGEIGIGSLIRLLSEFGLSENATRSAVSRMCRSGLLKAKRNNGGSYYSLTDEGQELLAEGENRIFSRKNSKWDGNWSIVTYSIPEKERKARDTLRLELGWLGYGALAEATWVSPYDLIRELEALLKRLGIRKYAHVFCAQHAGSTEPREIISRCWNLPGIHKKYIEFLNDYSPRLAEHLKRIKKGETIPPNECFVARFNLIHEYRKLPFYDPDLPLELLPENWLRPDAAALFDEYHDLLTEKANEYFNSVSVEYSANKNNKDDSKSTGRTRKKA